MMKLTLSFIISLIPYLHIQFSDYKPDYSNMDYVDIKIEINNVSGTMYYYNDTSIFASGISTKSLDLYNYNYIAISRDLYSKNGGFFNFHDTITIYNSGHKSNKKYIIIDLMHEKWKKKVDFLEFNHNRIYRYKNIQIVYTFREKI